MLVGSKTSLEQTHITSEIVGSILAAGTREKSPSTLCRKSWVFSVYSDFLPQGKLTGWADPFHRSCDPWWVIKWLLAEALLGSLRLGWAAFFAIQLGSHLQVRLISTLLYLLLSSNQWTNPQLTKILNSTSLDKNFVTAWKSITKLVIFQRFVAKYCKMRII
jgi:hypothetical protein